MKLRRKWVIAVAVLAGAAFTALGAERGRSAASATSKPAEADVLRLRAGVWAAGWRPSWTLDLLGQCAPKAGAIRYARIALGPRFDVSHGRKPVEKGVRIQ